MDLDRIVDDLSNVYWFEIERDNPSYVYAIDKIRELCSKYGVTYRTSKDEIFHDFIEEESNEANLLEEIRNDIESAASEELGSSFVS